METFLAATGVIECARVSITPDAVVVKVVVKEIGQALLLPNCLK
jgi:hypothetical protein